MPGARPARQWRRPGRRGGENDRLLCAKGHRGASDQRAQHAELQVLQDDRRSHCTHHAAGGDGRRRLGQRQRDHGWCPAGPGPCCGGGIPLVWQGTCAADAAVALRRNAQGDCGQVLHTQRPPHPGD